MHFKEQLKADLKTAMKAKDKVSLVTIRAIMSAVQYEEMQKSKDIEEAQFLAILKNEVKKRKETIEFLEKEDRTEEIAENNAEIAIIENYLPTQLDNDKLKNILVEFKEQNESANMGTAMKFLKDSYPGQYDGKEASTIAKSVF